jgi:hypothetical protein
MLASAVMLPPAIARRYATAPSGLFIIRVVTVIVRFPRRSITAPGTQLGSTLWLKMLSVRLLATLS